MIRQVLTDTGPVVALIDCRDHYHSWARAQVAELRPPLLTCEAVLTEACYLLRNLNGGAEAVLEMVKRELVTLPFRLDEEVARIATLMRRYINVPMSLANACLVRMAEQHTDSLVMTLDSDFGIYRKHGRQIVTTITPADS